MDVKNANCVDIVYTLGSLHLSTEHKEYIKYGVDTLITAMRPTCFSQGFAVHDIGSKKWGSLFT